MRLHQTLDGVSERQRDIYGIPVKSILPINATSYNAKPSLAENALRSARHPSSAFVSCTKRWKAPPESPGPVDYVLTHVLVVPRAPAAVILSEERHCDSPIRRDPIPMRHDLIPMLPPNSASRSKRGTLQCGGGISPELDSCDANSPRAQDHHAPGIRIPVAKRNLNIHNLNSRLERNQDLDFDNPPPGMYDTSSPQRHKEFSVLRGTFNGTGRNSGTHPKKKGGAQKSDCNVTPLQRKSNC